MLYTIRNDEVVTLTPDDVSEQEMCVGCLTLDELHNCYHKLHIPQYAIDECIDNLLSMYSSAEVFDTFSYGVINVVDMLEMTNIRKQVGFYFQKNLFLVVGLDEDTDSALDEKLLRGLSQLHRPATMEKMLCSVLDQLFLSGYQELTFAERIVSVLEQQVANNETDSQLDKELFELRNRISALKSFSDQMLDISETLLADKNDILGSDHSLYLRNLTTKSERMGERAQILNDNLLHLWELLESRMDQKMNNTMNVLAIVSIIFQPMSMIAGWYGMNFFNMPEYTWEYGYLFCIILNILIVAGLTLYFKRKKLL